MYCFLGANGFFDEIIHRSRLTVNDYLPNAVDWAVCICVFEFDHSLMLTLSIDWSLHNLFSKQLYGPIIHQTGFPHACSVTDPAGVSRRSRLLWSGLVLLTVGDCTRVVQSNGKHINRLSKIH